jgi:AAA domain
MSVRNSRDVRREKIAAGDVIYHNGESTGEPEQEPLEDERTSPEAEVESPRTYIEFLAPSQILAYTPPADLVLVGDNHLVRGSVTVLAGPPGVGKSRGSLALAEAGATQFEWFGLPVHSLFRTLVIQNENGMSRLQSELREMAEPRLEQYLRVCPPPPYGLCFWRADFREQLKRFSETFGPHVVVLDPWNSVTLTTGQKISWKPSTSSVRYSLQARRGLRS